MSSQSNTSEKKYDDNEEAIGYVDEEGEWRYRKINVLSVVRSFVSQLKPGQDLTRVSLPAEVCYPFGLIELLASRMLKTFCLLFEMNRGSPGPLERFFVVLRFFMGMVRTETLNKKPWNAVLGENHVAWIEHPTEPDQFENNSIFVGEQVSHHPPVTALCIRNAREDMSVESNAWFGVRFGGNYASVTTKGELYIRNTRLNESYRITEVLPDIVVRNIIWGQKYIIWEGEVSIECPETNLSARIKFKESANKKNSLKGYIMDKNNVVLAELEGLCGKQIYVKMSSESDLDIARRTLLIDFENESWLTVRYLTYDKLDPLSTVRVWKQVNDAIVANNMFAADKEKKQVEMNQRDRIKALEESGAPYQGKYFSCEENGVWTYNDALDAEKLGVERRWRSCGAPRKSKMNANEGGMGSMPTVTKSEGLPNESRLDDAASSLMPAVSEEAYASPGYADPSRGDVRVKSDAKAPLADPIKSAEEDGTHNEKRLRKKNKKKMRDEVKMVYSKMKEVNKENRHTEFETEEIYAGWVKIRNSFKKWRERWAVLQSGRLVYYRTQGDVARRNCAGILMLNGCDVRPRPTKKGDSCFKVYNVNHYSIYSKNGLKGETISRALLPVSDDYAIIRVKENLQKWLECVRQAIPDWEKNKPLFESAVADGIDSMTDEESECSGETDVSKAEDRPPSHAASSNIEDPPVVSHQIKQISQRQDSCFESIEERLKDMDVLLREIHSRSQEPSKVIHSSPPPGRLPPEIHPAKSSGTGCIQHALVVLFVCALLISAYQFYQIQRRLSNIEGAVTSFRRV